IRHLPPELLSDIFFKCLSKDTFLLPNPKRLGPPLLAQVCKHWRDTAIGTPSLWTSLRI
ncbi:hypothetical protein NEOLEDRAFT_1021599, partial [Neolentinus lepideus HHB14362 ss-1]